jgi:hypothetical protein
LDPGTVDGVEFGLLGVEALPGVVDIPEGFEVPGV